MNPIPSTLQPRIGLIACLLIALGCDAGYEGASAAPGAEGGKPQGSSSKSPQTSGSATSEKSPKQEKSVVRVHVYNDKGELVGPVESARVVKSEAEWRKQLTPEQYKILRNHATEPAFCGTYVAQKKNGVGTYHCAGCAAPLFTSDTKFESGTGWPSFFQPLPRRLGAKEDNAHGMQRTEVLSKSTGIHLGHVFDDGPDGKPRYCINATVLEFRPREALTAAAKD